MYRLLAPLDLPARAMMKAATYDFQLCGILTSVNSEEPVQPLFILRNSIYDVQSSA